MAFAYGMLPAAGSTTPAFLEACAIDDMLELSHGGAWWPVKLKATEQVDVRGTQVTQ